MSKTPVTPVSAADHKTYGVAPLTWAFRMERVTGIEPALSAWESVPYGLLCSLTCGENSS